MTRTIQSIKHKEVVHCPTEEQATKFCKLLHDAGKEWSSGDSYLKKIYYNYYGSDTCYNVNEGSYCNIRYYGSEKYNVISCEEFFEQPPVWVWGKVDKVGLWAHGNMGDEPVFQSAKYYNEVSNSETKSWVAYLGPIPEIKAPEIEYTKLKFSDIDVNNFPETVYTKFNGEYYKKTLCGISIKPKELKYFFSDLSTALHIYAKKT